MATYREIILGKLKEARHNRNLTQDEFGKLLNVSRVTVIRWENGQREPDLETLALASSLFDIDISPQTVQDCNIKEVNKHNHKLYELLDGASEQQLDFVYNLLQLVKNGPKL